MDTFGTSQPSDVFTDRARLEVAILEASPDAIAGADRNGMLNFWNAAATRVFGYAENEILGHSIEILLLDDEERTNTIAKVNNGEMVVGLEAKGRCKDARVIDVALNISPVKSANSEVVGMSIAMQDITRRKRAESELRESEQRFLTISHATNDATYDWDIVEDRLNWDPGITALFGYQLEEIEPNVLWWHDHLHPDERQRVMRSLQLALDSGAEKWVEKYRFRCANGAYAVVVDRGFFVRGSSGGAVRMLGGMTDVTENEMAQARQAALLDLGDRLRDENRLTGIATVATEIAGRTLGVAHAGFGMVAPGGDSFRVSQEWGTGELPSCDGHHRFEDCFPASAARLHQGEIVASGDAECVLERMPRLKSFLHVPILKDNQLSGVLYLHDTRSRQWSEQEIAFVRSVADRAWAAMERVQFETKLKESEAQFRTIADLVPDHLWRRDPEGGNHWNNRKKSEYTGRTEAELRGMGWLDTVHPDDRDQALAAFRRAMETETPMTQEYRIRRKDGQYRWFLSRAEPMRDERGKIIQWFGAATDIHEQRIALEALKVQEERYRMLIELAPHTVWMAEWDGHITYCSTWWYEYTGMTERETVGLGWINAIHPDHRAKLKDAWLHAVRCGGEWNVEIPFRRASDGAYRWHLASGMPIRDERGHIQRWIGIAIDVHDRKEAAQALQREKALLDGLAEALLDGILIVSAEGKLLYYNQRFLEIWRIPPGIMESRSEAEALAFAVSQVEDAAAFKAKVSAVYEGAAGPVRTELRMKDGRIYDHFGAPVRKDDVHYGWVWTFRDITEQKHAEAELRESERKHQFLNRFNEGIRELANAGDIMTAAARLLGQHLNASCCAYADIEPESEHFRVEEDYVEGCADLAGRHRLSLLGTGATSLMRGGRTLVIDNAEVDLSPGEGTEMFRALGAKAVVCCPLVKEGQLKAMMLVHQTDPRHWAESEVRVVEAVVERCWSTIERARAEHALRDSEQRFRQLAEAMPQLVWTVTPEGEPDFVNSRWVEYTGIQDFRHFNWLQAIHPDDRERTRTLWTKSLETATDFGMEQRLLGPDGYRWFQARTVPIRDSSGKPIKWFGTATDIDDVVKAREALARSQADLEQLVEERTAKLQETIAQLEAFSYSISHDMRGPLRAMQGFSYILLQRYKDKLDEAGLEFLHAIERSAKRLDNLIQDVLTYSRYSKAEVQLVPVDVAQLVRDIVSQYPGLQPPKAIIRIQEPLYQVMAQASYLTQALSNLLSNAVKFVPPDRTPEVTIRAERYAGTIRVFVEDNGIGIEPKDQERIFNIFERVHSPGEFEGTGIGLSIVRKVMERMGGRVGLESTEGQGSCFWIELKEA